VHIGARLAQWSPGVMAAISWFILLLYGLALLLPAGRGVASEQRVELLVALIMMGSLSSTIARGYLHQAPPAGALGLVPVLGFLALSLALLFARPEGSPMRLLTSARSGGMMARRTGAALGLLLICAPSSRVAAVLAKPRRS